LMCSDSVITLVVDLSRGRGSPGGQGGRSLPRTICLD
jgi:hypothetical protein